MSGFAALYWVCLIATGLVVIHALTRSERAWLHADRSKSYWVAWLVIGAIFGPVGIIAAIVYFIAVVSRMTTSDRTPGPFDKQ